MSRTRNWMFTSFKDKVEITDAGVKYFIYQREKAPTTGKEHWQGYIEFKDAKTMQQVKNYFDDDKIHVEPRRGTQEQAIAYCSKEDTRIGDTISGGVRSHQGERSDLTAIYDSILDGATPKQILLTHGANSLRYFNCIMKACNEIYEFEDSLTKKIKHKREIVPKEIRKEYHNYFLKNAE